MKLKLSHITPYAAYKLKVIYEGIECGLEGFDLHLKNTVIVERINVNLKEIKPILRPISDLDKEIEINGKKFIPINKLEDEFPDSIKYKNTDKWRYIKLMCDDGTECYNLLAIPLEAIQLLTKWHFDVFNLINNELAIDINTLKQTT